jgi:hypothetical protein
MDKSDTATNMNSHGRQLKAAVFYFSGTGTTEIAARHTVDCLEKRGYDASLIRIEDFLKRQQEIDIRQYALIGIGSQVIAFDTPGIVLRFVKKLPAGNNARTFIFRLAGGVAPINFNASNKLKRMLKRKGYDVFYERLFSIGSNWMVKFDDRIVRRLYYSTMSKIDSMCDDIAEGQHRVLRTGLFSRTIPQTIPVRIAANALGIARQTTLPRNMARSGSDFRATAACDVSTPAPNTR